MLHSGSGGGLEGLSAKCCMVQGTGRYVTSHAHAHAQLAVGI